MISEGHSLVISGPPQPDESFMGYIVRLTEWNRYDSPSWILNRIRVSGQSNFGSCSFMFNNSTDLSFLARFIDTDPNELISMMYLPAMNKTGKHIIFGQSISRFMIREKRPKVCPACLCSSNYNRRIWELVPTTVCPFHNCLLLDECPNCKRHISWVRSSVSICNCKYDWRNATTDKVEHSELTLARQIHRVCGILEPNDNLGHLKKSNPLSSLGLKDLMSALTFVASQFQGINDTSGKYITSFKKNKDCHRILMKGFAVFEDWPDLYFQLLEDRRKQTDKSEFKSGLKEDFGNFRIMLYKALKSEALNFMQISFEEYLRLHWDGGTLFSRSLRFTEENKRYLSRIETIRRLEVTDEWIDKLIGEKKLNPILHTKQTYKFMLFDRSEVEEVKRYLEQLLTTKDVGELLGVGRVKVVDLVHEKCLKPIHGPSVDGFKFWKFSRSEIDELIDQIDSRIIKSKTETNHELLDFKKVISKISISGIGIATLIRAIQNREISPCGKTQKPGLDRFVFEKKQILKYLKGIKQERRKDSISIIDAAKIMKISAATVYTFIDEGLLAAQKVHVGKGLSIRTTHNAINTFNVTYVLAAKASKAAGTSSRLLIRCLREKGIQPVLGADDSSENQYVFRKSDIEHIDLVQLVQNSKVEQDPKGKKFMVINAEQVAELMGLNKAEVGKLVENGQLKIHSRLPNNSYGQEYLFYRSDVEEYCNSKIDYSELLSGIEASQMLKESFSGFTNRWIKTKAVTPIKFNHLQGKIYFLRKDIEALIQFKKDTISSREAAQILGVRKETLFGWTVAGKLTPVSGPNIDNYGWNMYLRSDVESLLEQRNRNS